MSLKSLFRTAFMGRETLATFPYISLDLSRLGLNTNCVFRSLCSIRSTQCAVLIALAAVAGLSRFEAASQPERSGIDNLVDCTTDFYTRPVVRFLADCLSFALRFSQATPKGQATETQTATVTLQVIPVPEIPTRPAETASQTNLSFYPARTFTFSSRRHEIPYAVGPPATGILLNLLSADGMAMPGDSAESGKFAVFSSSPIFASESGVVRGDAVPAEVGLSRLLSSAPIRVGPNFEPVFALRGESPRDRIPHNRAHRVLPISP